ncbi:MAG TPA: glycosyl hydrolase family 18 protein, partial [Thermoanaerobaculia bacterium]|nr:glycosyl hydrolase family 18 protein [Thermoanaerobaculia bacterium]
MSDRAVFFDPTHRRWWWVKRLGTLLGLFAVVTISAWLVSLFTAPLLPGVPGITSAIVRSLRLPHHQARKAQFLLAREQRKLLTAIAQDEKARKVREAKGPIRTTDGIVAAFYAPWQETGMHSLEANAQSMTHLLPVWVHLSPDARRLDYHDWDPVLTPHNIDVVKIARSNNLNIVPVFSNAELSNTGTGQFDPKRVHVFLSNPHLQEQTIMLLRQWCMRNQFQGINVDFENVPAQDYPSFIDFLRRMKANFAPVHLIVSADLEATRPLDWRAVSSICDFVVVMAYDEHGENSPEGPIASIAWYRAVVQRALISIPLEKLVVGVGNYAYDWTEGGEYGEPLTYQGALILAQNFRQGEKPEDIVDFDDEYLNPTFDYIDDEHKNHHVWMLDAVTAANQWLIASNYGSRGVAVWVLGSADPSIWTFIKRGHIQQPPNMVALNKVEFPYDLEFVGDGEIAHVDKNPSPGTRSVEIDPQTGIAVDESYHKFPTSYVV